MISEILINEIVVYFDRLRNFAEDDFTYYITHVQSKEINFEISVNFQIEPTTPVLGYTKTFQLIEENKTTFSDNIFELIKKIIEGSNYRLQTSSVQITQFKLTINFILI